MLQFCPQLQLELQLLLQDYQGQTGMQQRGCAEQDPHLLAYQLEAHAVTFRTPLMKQMLPGD